MNSCTIMTAETCNTTYVALRRNMSHLFWVSGRIGTPGERGKRNNPTGMVARPDREPRRQEQRREDARTGARPSMSSLGRHKRLSSERNSDSGKTLFQLVRQLQPARVRERCHLSIQPERLDRQSFPETEPSARSLMFLHP